MFGLPNGTPLRLCLFGTEAGTEHGHGYGGEDRLRGSPTASRWKFIARATSLPFPWGGLY